MLGWFYMGREKCGKKVLVKSDNAGSKDSYCTICTALKMVELSGQAASKQLVFASLTEALVD